MGLSYQSYWYGTDQDLICFDSLGFYFFPNCEERQYSLQVIGHGEEELALFDRFPKPAEKSRCIFDFFALLGMLLPKMQYEAAIRTRCYYWRPSGIFVPIPMGESGRRPGIAASANPDFTRCFSGPDIPPPTSFGKKYWWRKPGSC